VSRSIVHVRRKKKDTDPLRSAWHILEDWVEVNKDRILMISGIAAGLVAVVAVAYYFFDYREEKRLAAYSAAYDKFTATVGSSTPSMPGLGGPNKVTFPDEQTKFAESGAAFEKLASDYGTYRDIGHYYAGLSYLHTDAARGEQLLQELADGSSDVRYEARLALAENYAATGANDKAEQRYQQLADDPGKLPRLYILNQLGAVKERLGKPAEAAPLYKTVIDADRNGSFGPDAEKGLQRVDPAAAAALPPKTTAPGGSPAPFSMQQGGQPGPPKR
jgi:tetratricopeptide (TPR) repeat protein